LPSAGGWSWVDDEFRDREWLTFFVDQSCHSGDEARVHWLPDGPHVADWPKEPPRPVVNVEPNDDAYPSYASGIRFTAA
jgi:hypothetical protein